MTGHEGGQGGGASLGDLKLSGVTLGVKEKVGGDRVENQELGPELLHHVSQKSDYLAHWVPRTNGHGLLVLEGLPCLIILYMTRFDSHLLPTLVTKGCSSIVYSTDSLWLVLFYCLT